MHLLWNELFNSEGKYNSGCGCSLSYGIKRSNIQRIEDLSHGMKRISKGQNCDSHLGSFRGWSSNTAVKILHKLRHLIHGGIIYGDNNTKIWKQILGIEC